MCALIVSFLTLQYDASNSHILFLDSSGTSRPNQEEIPMNWDYSGYVLHPNFWQFRLVKYKMTDLLWEILVSLFFYDVCENNNTLLLSSLSLLSPALLTKPLGTHQQPITQSIYNVSKK